MRKSVSFRLMTVFFLASISYARAQPQEPSSLFIEGYAGKVSYKPGDELTLHVSTGAAKYSLEIARLGAKREVVLVKEGLAGAAHKTPENASSHGCGWPASFKFQLPPTWKSGYYQVVLKAEDRGGQFVQRGKRTAESECFFIVRAAEPGKDSKILLQLCTNTYNAYNNWGGYQPLRLQRPSQGARAPRLVPPAPRDAVSQLGTARSSRGPRPTATRSTMPPISTSRFQPELLLNYKLVLSVGHDEYWSAACATAWSSYIGAGGNVAFFSGNTCCWQVRSEDDGRALVVLEADATIRTRSSAPAITALLTTLWSHHLVGRPENTLTGVGFLWGGYHKSHGQFMDGPAAYTVHRPEHWLFAGTKLKRGDEFGGKDTIVGYECDGCELVWKDGLPFPTHRDGTPKSFVILGTCPANWHPDDCLWYERFEKDRVGNAVLGVYEKNEGIVFTCGSTDWSHGLRGRDPIVERITKNVLDKLSK